MWKVLLINVLVCATYTAALLNLDTESCKNDPNAHIGCAGRCHRTCDDYERDSPQYSHECVHACLPACDCKRGYVYDKTRQLCVVTSDCPAKNSTSDDTESCKNDPNAYIGCAGRCHRTCDDYERNTQEYAWECPHVCLPACDCQHGYVYDKTRKLCVVTEHCPAKNTGEGTDDDTSEDTSDDTSDDSNDDTSEDTSDDTSDDSNDDSNDDTSEDNSEDTSDDAGQDTSQDTDDDSDEDTSGDTNKDNGEDTESCKNDPNAYIGCAGRCHRTCNDYERNTQEYAWECPHVCIPACDCKHGYVYDKTRKLCVVTSDCPAIKLLY